ncbi:optic atrophy 3 protein homolog [Choristoneura fumiferana]|uniref:optic atrophy 3 protein homolog n=1 Tax=Choristoneura fumiferana TaxID=7141 RepID=UPI003D15E1DB
MVIGAFPIAKLSVLLIKQISKPIANACKERAKKHPFFRTYVCMPPAQFYNWCEVKAKMWILNLGRPVNIPVLSQEMAIELGANLLGESVIFFIGAGLLIIEYNRQSKKETAKEEKRIAELSHITSTITDLYFTVQQQQTQLREMERIIHSVSEYYLSKNWASGPNGPSGGAPAVPPVQTKPKNCSQSIRHDGHVTPTPYPDKGIILQSLNYIQMDVFCSVFPHSKTEEHDTKSEEKLKINQKRENAVLSEALYNIENNFRSLF